MDVHIVRGLRASKLRISIRFSNNDWLLPSQILVSIYKIPRNRGMASIFSEIWFISLTGMEIFR